jgi:DNA-binding transcriptional MerR regulator
LYSSGRVCGGFSDGEEAGVAEGASSGERGYLRIGELARRTGVSPELLRAWERRYGVLAPRRTSGGYRLYGDLDERRIRRMRELIDDGLSAAEAARLALEPAGEPDRASGPPAVTPDLVRIAASFEDGLDRFDEAAAHVALDRLLSRFTVATAFRDVLLPYLRRLGERWSEGTVTVGQEHFASNVIRGRLLGLARGWGDGRGPVAVLACPPGELHDLALVMFGVVLSGLGWRIAFLGPDTPIDTLVDAATRLEPDVVVLSATLPLPADRADLLELARTAPVAVAGPGAADGPAEALPSRLRGDPVAAAGAVAAGWRPATSS